MNENLHDAESLDQIVAGLLHDPAGLTSEGIDAETADMLQKVVKIETAFSGPPEVTRRKIWQQVMAHSTGKPIIARPTIVPTRKVRLVMGLAVAAIVLLITGVVITSGTKPVSAAEILAKAQQIEANPTAFGFRLLTVSESNTIPIVFVCFILNTHLHLCPDRNIPCPPPLRVSSLEV
jgi:hypothetical protein